MLDDSSILCSFSWVSWLPYRPLRSSGRFRCLALLLVSLLSSRAVSSQPAPTPEEVQQAQARWKEGKAFFDAGNFEAARVAFRQAYTIFPHPAFLQNLGEAELRSGRYVEAARHLAQYLHLSTSGSPAQRDGAKTSLKKASEKLASIVIETNADDAEVRVDEEFVGRTPLGGLAWFVEPGKHAVVARRSGYIDGTETVELSAGASKNVYVRLAQLVEGAAIAPAAARPAAKPTLASAPVTPTVAPDRESHSSDARTVVLLTGTALTVVAATVGAYYAVRTGADSNKYDSARASIPSGSSCATPTPEIESACSAVVHYNSQLRTDQNIRNGAFVVAGVLGVATITTFFLWPARSSSTAVVPVVGPHFAGIVAEGRL